MLCSETKCELQIKVAGMMGAGESGCKQQQISHITTLTLARRLPRKTDSLFFIWLTAALTDRPASSWSSGRPGWPTCLGCCQLGRLTGLADWLVSRLAEWLCQSRFMLPGRGDNSFQTHWAPHREAIRAKPTEFTCLSCIEWKRSGQDSFTLIFYITDTFIHNH